ncbi:5-formyltetrahydrofolate cyclo-ligase [Mycovorax composti]|jgi:5,10-methenyltetrahydrofolate synthetase|uniref:5-formyltetrahydrofolate cyclo-ligase n=2 Tax=Chitinophagaceae TaxID=563835 RepID=A0ABZ2END7_9BACT
MLKSEARKLFSKKRKEIPYQQRLKWDDLILIHFQKLPLLDIRTVLTYAAMDVEVNTDPLVDYMLFRNPMLQIAYPISDFSNGTMQAVVVSQSTSFIKSRRGILEPDPATAVAIPPESIDMVIVPLLCFDKDGYRVGYGKGFYDRYLAHARPDVIKVGLSYFDPIDKVEDRNEFDVPLNYCITPERMYEF